MQELVEFEDPRHLPAEIEERREQLVVGRGCRAFDCGAVFCGLVIH